MTLKINNITCCRSSLKQANIIITIIILIIEIVSIPLNSFLERKCKDSFFLREENVFFKIINGLFILSIILNLFGLKKYYHYYMIPFKIFIFMALLCFELPYFIIYLYIISILFGYTGEVFSNIAQYLTNSFDCVRIIVVIGNILSNTNNQYLSVCAIILGLSSFIFYTFTFICNDFYYKELKKEYLNITEKSKLEDGDLTKTNTKH